MNYGIVLGITILGIIIGLIGVILPILPGLGLVYLSILFYSAMTGFEIIGITTNIILAIVTLTTMILGYINSIILLKKLGLSQHSVRLAAGGSLLGLFLAKTRGMIIGQLIGAVTGEMIETKSIKMGLKAGGASLAAFILSTLIDLIVASFLIVVFISKIT